MRPVARVINGQTQAPLDYLSGLIMKLTELAFPITIVAPDGWASYSMTPHENEKWSIPAIRKYNKIGFIVVDSRERAYRLVSIVPESPITAWERLRAIFSSRPRPVHINVELMEGDGLSIFREHFLRALSLDDDCLSQFHSKEKIGAIVRETTPLSKLMARLAKMRVTA